MSESKAWKFLGDIFSEQNCVREIHGVYLFALDETDSAFCLCMAISWLSRHQKITKTIALSMLKKIKLAITTKDKLVLAPYDLNGAAIRRRFCKNHELATNIRKIEKKSRSKDTAKW